MTAPFGGGEPIPPYEPPVGDPYEPGYDPDAYGSRAFDPGWDDEFYTGPSGSRAPAPGWDDLDLFPVELPAGAPNAQMRVPGKVFGGTNHAYPSTLGALKADPNSGMHAAGVAPGDIEGGRRLFTRSAAVPRVRELAQRLSYTPGGTKNRDPVGRAIRLVKRGAALAVVAVGVRIAYDHVPAVHDTVNSAVGAVTDPQHQATARHYVEGAVEGTPLEGPAHVVGDVVGAVGDVAGGAVDATEWAAGMIKDHYLAFTAGALLTASVVTGRGRRVWGRVADRVSSIPMPRMPRRRGGGRRPPV